MNAVWVIAIKDLRQLLRDRMACFFALGFPLIVAVFFGTIFSGAGGDSDGGGNRIHVLVVDEDQTDGSRSFVRTLENSSELSVTTGADRAAALDLVRRGKSAACIVLPAGFGASRENLFWGGGTKLQFAVDPSRRAEAGMLEGILTKYGFMQMQEAFQNPGKMRDQLRDSLARLRGSTANPATRKLFERFFGQLDAFLVDLPSATDAQPADSSTAAAPEDKPRSGETPSASNQGGMGGWQPVRLERLELPQAEGAPKAKPPGSFALTFPQGVIWGVMGCALGFSIGLVLERTRGTMIRLRVAPLSRAQILAGKALACFLATVAVAALVLLIGVIGFGVRPNSYPLLLIAIFCVGVCFVGIMMLLAAFSRSERGGNSLGWGILLMFSMIGGGMIPLFFMPGWMQSLSVISPIRWSILALEGAIWRGFTPAEMLQPCGILLAIGLGAFFIGARALGKTED